MSRIKLFHKVSVTLPNGKQKHTRSVGCKPYVVAVRWRIDGHLNEWKVLEWCPTYNKAEKISGDLARQYAGWSHKQPEMAILNTSCHIATGVDAGASK